MRIILARHGETIWNREEIFRGRADVRLNETGIKQAELLAGYLKETSLEAVLSSPLRRARDTAAIVAKPHNLAVEIHDGLIDFDYGEWAAITRREAEAKWPGLYEKWFNTPHLVAMPGGERLSDMRERLTGVIREVTSKYRDSVVLVSHRAVNRVIICYLLGLDDSHFWNVNMDNASITTFSYENGRFTLECHNDTSFLKALKK